MILFADRLVGLSSLVLFELEIVYSPGCRSIVSCQKRLMSSLSVQEQPG
jgi:hypothetical protein